MPQTQIWSPLLSGNTPKSFLPRCQGPRLPRELCCAVLLSAGTAAFYIQHLPVFCPLIGEGAKQL